MSATPVTAPVGAPATASPVVLRPHTDADDGFVRDLFVHERRARMLAAGLPGEQAGMLADLQYAGWAASLPAGAEQRVAWQGTDRVGHVVTTLAEDLRLVWVGVAPSRRRAGIGRSLVRDVLDRARTHGRDVSLRVDPTNAVAIALYTGLGFVETARDTDLHLTHTVSEDTP